MTDMQGRPGIDQIDMSALSQRRRDYYPSVRYQKGECISAFRSNVLASAVGGGHVRYYW